MSNCKAYPLGCFGHCDKITLPIQAPPGKSRLILKSGKGTKKIELIAVGGEDICINTQELNECAQYEVCVYDCDGELITFDKDGITYNRFAFEINIVTC